MKIYIVWSCDNTEYSDMQDWPIKAFVRKDKAEALRIILDVQERKGLGKDEWPSYYHRVSELFLEEL